MNFPKPSNSRHGDSTTGLVRAKATMTTEKAIELLKGWQSQIIHGQNIFGEIADHLMEMQSALDGANNICRSMHSIAKREGKQTNWSAFKGQLDKELSIQHDVLWPNGGDM